MEPRWRLGRCRRAGLWVQGGFGGRRGGQHPVAYAAVVGCAVRRRRVFEDRLLVARRFREPGIVANRLEAFVFEVALQCLEYLARPPGPTIGERRGAGGYAPRGVS